MDFIAIDLDQHDIWDAFRQPMPVREQIYLKTAYWGPVIQSEEVDCNTDNPNDGCFKDDRESSPRVLFGNGSLSGGGSDLWTGSDETEFLLGETGLSEELGACILEQLNERLVDAAAQQAANEINEKEPELEHATFGVNDGNSIVTITISTGDSEQADMATLIHDLAARGYDMSQVVFFIHSHPSSTISLPSLAASEDFANQFPSDNDMNAYSEFANEAVGDGADRAAWLSNFRAYIVGPDDKNREYGNFTSNESDDSVSSADVYDFEGAHPVPETDAYQRVQDTANHAETDAANGCE